MALTAKQYENLIFKVGSTARIKFPGNGSMYIRVRIEDAREVFGRLDFKVSPLEGDGSVWVSENAMARDTAPVGA